MTTRIIFVIFSLLLSSCSQFATIDLNERNVLSNDAISSFCNEYGLIQDKTPWIRGHNRWSNSPDNTLLRSWSGEYEGQPIMLVELLRSGRHILVVEIRFGKDSPKPVAYELKGRLYQAGIKHKIVIDIQNFASLT